MTGAAAAGPVLEVRGLVKHFPVRTGFWRRQTGVVHAVCGVDLELARGETLGLVGESGSGKSTVGRCVLRLVEPTAGQVHLEGQDLATLTRSQLRAVRPRLQIVFQDPYASLNPRQTVGTTIAEPLRIHGRWDDREGPRRVADLLERVGLSPDHAGRYPHEFSGGQRQRIGVARAIALDPTVLVLDEPVSALDVSIQAGVVNLLADLQETLGLAYLFIAHDLSVVRHISTRVAVMYLGSIVETGPRDEIYDEPAHPYTKALLSAVPVPDPRVERRRQRILLEGDPPDPTDPPSGCRFRTRCPLFANELTQDERQACIQEPPALVDRGNGHPAACHYATRTVVSRPGGRRS